MTAKVALLLQPNFNTLDLSVLTVLGIANHFAPGSYQVEIMSAEGGIVHSISGVGVETRPFDAIQYDILMVGSTPGVPLPQPDLVARLRAMPPPTRRIVSICTGAFLLGAAGLFDGHEVTTHWAFADALASQLPRARVVPDRIFIQEDQLWSSAGMTACIDMALAMVEQDLGSAITKQICKTMVLYHRRPGGQSQFSVLAQIDPQHGRIRKALTFIRDHLGDPLTVQQLAEHVNWSPRHFSRAFRIETGMPPAKAIERLRVEAAQTLIDAGHTSTTRIAHQVGFGDDERMRRAFLRVLGKIPSALMRDVRGRRLQAIGGLGAH